MTPTQEQIKIAWDALYNRVIHKTNPPDKLLENFGTLYDAWQTASAKTLSPTEMTKWAARYSEQLVLVEGWERVYPVAQKSNVKTGTGKVTELAPTNVTGALPWWYWPLRVSAGIGAGYVVYRTLRPGQKPQSMRSTYRPTFAGLSNIPDRGPERPSGQGWKKVPSVMSGGKPFFWYRNEGGNRQTYMWNRQTQRWEYS
jgi:hypothetical protein